MKKLLIICLFIQFTNPLSSQCLTDHYHQLAKKNNPAIAIEEINFNQEVVQVGNSKRATKFIIPVVFHVIHTNGPENISRQQIEDQIRVLNEDFSLKNSNKSNIRSQFANLAADCEIEFRIAKLDPNGNCTDGINRIYSPLHVNARENVKFISGAKWDYRKYLNVWIVSSIEDANQSGGSVLGFAYLPSAVASGLGAYDGIVARADRIGTIGTANVNDGGRTLTHEVGHYLGLYHTFDDGCSGTGSNNGDYCADTPPVSGTFTNANCPANGNSCTTDFPDLIDQWENYMDYSNGSCQSMFSPNQKSRMHSTLNNYSFRKTLVSTSNLIATGVENSNVAPLAFFTSSSRQVCVGEPVYYYDLSCKAQVLNKQWTFAGANITSTNKDTPVVSYSSPGKYKVTLLVSNAMGNNSLAVENYIEVRPAVAIDKPSVTQNFESPTWDQGSGWSILDEGSIKFFRDSTSAYRGKSSLLAPITSNTPLGQRFQIATPPTDLRPLKGLNPKLSMMIAYVRQNTSSSEELRFYYSRGCSNTWTQFYYRNASFISYNSGAFAPTFSNPDNNQWKQITFSLAAYENDSNIAFMIEVLANGGNPVYIDDINIGQFNTSVSSTSVLPDLLIYPNPIEDLLNISYINPAGETEVWLENLEGKKISCILDVSEQNGLIQIQYHKEAHVIPGIYILKIRSNNQIVNKKVIFAN